MKIVRYKEQSENYMRQAMLSLFILGAIAFVCAFHYIFDFYLSLEEWIFFAAASGFLFVLMIFSLVMYCVFLKKDRDSISENI